MASAQPARLVAGRAHETTSTVSEPTTRDGRQQDCSTATEIGPAFGTVTPICYDVHVSRVVFTALDQGLYDHEGYVELVLDDGSETSSWSAAIASDIVASYPACSCRWRGSPIPADEADALDDDGEDVIYREWDVHIAEPLAALGRVEAVLAVRDDLDSALREMREALVSARLEGSDWPEIAGAMRRREEWVRATFG